MITGAARCQFVTKNDRKKLEGYELLCVVLLAAHVILALLSFHRSILNVSCGLCEVKKTVGKRHNKCCSTPNLNQKRQRNMNVFLHVVVVGVTL